MKTVELFSGAGGAALGLHAAGFEHLACIERDPDAHATATAAGFPSVLGDVRTVDYSPWVGCDAVWASPPCQCWSQAGTRTGARDSERNGWPATWDAVDELKPTWLMAENVRGLLMHTGGDKGCDRSSPMDCARCYFDQVILVEARNRFAWVSWWLLDAADFGVPQHRRRVFLVAGPRPLTPPYATHGPGLFTVPYRTVRDALGDCVVIGGGGNPHGPDADHERNYRDLTDEPCTTIAASHVGNGGPYVINARILDRPSVAVSASYDANGSSPAVPHKMNGACDLVCLATGGAKRRLTIAECATLQDFPPDHPWQGTKTAQYRQVGNAVPPKLAEVVGRQVMGAACSHR